MYRLVQDGKTPRQIAFTKEMRRAIDRARLYGETTAPPRIRLFLCGHGEVGKSTLARALQRSDIAASLLSLPSAHNERTHGFATFPATIPGAGECTIVDFAGQSEYWVPNGMLMATESGVFLVLCNLADPPDMQFRQLRYWLRFIASRASLEAKPRVALVGTHRSAVPTLKKKLSNQSAADQEKTKQQIERLGSIKQDGDRWVSTSVESVVTPLLAEFADLLHMSPYVYYVDSVSPHKIDRAEMRRLRKWLGLMFDDVRALRPVPTVCLDVAALTSKVRKTSITDVLAPFDRVLTELRVCAPDIVDLSDDDRVRAVLSHLSDTGDIMYFEDAGDVVVLQPHEFGERVIGQLFCPVGTPGFTSLLAIDKDLGYRFRRSALEEALKACNVGDIDVVLRILQDLDLVFPLHEGDGATDASSADALYAVPGRLAHSEGESLVKQFETMRTKAWRDATAGFHHVGIRLRINNSSLMLPPSTLSRLLHRLSGAPGFEMWQRGARTTRVLIGGDVSVEGLIDLADSLQYIDVVVRSEVDGQSALRLCVEHLRHVVATCEAVCAESVVRFEAKVIMSTPLRRDGTREVDKEAPPKLPADAKEAGLSQPQWVVAGLLPLPPPPPPRPPPTDVPRDAHDVLESILNTATATYHVAVENRGGIAAVRADVGAVAGKLDTLQHVLSTTLERYHAASNTRFDAIARAIADVADDAKGRDTSQCAIASRLTACVDALKEVGAHVTAGFKGCEDRDGAVAQELAAVRHALHDKMSDDEAAQARESEAFARIDSKLVELQKTVKRNHTVSEGHLDAITRAATAAAKARELGEIDIATKLDDCRGQLAELYRAVSVGDVRDGEQHSALQQAVEAITRAVEASGEEVRAAVASAASGIKSFSLSFTEHCVPSVFVVVTDELADAGAGGVLRSAAALLRDPVAFCKERLFGVARLRLVCMRTWEPVPCGEDGHGYKIQVGGGGVDGVGFARCLATLMRGTLVTARVFNAGASLARLFGIPAPKVPADTLQELVKAIDAGEDTPEFVKSDGALTQLWGERMRQYEQWLAGVDPDNRWGGLERELDEESNTVRWVSSQTAQSDAPTESVVVSPSDVVVTASAGADGGDSASSDGLVVHQGNVFVKETAMVGHPWRSHFWRVTRNADGGGWTVHQWQRAATDVASLPSIPSAVIRVPPPVGGTVAVCQDDTEFMERKRGKHRGVLKLVIAASGKRGRHITFRADVGSAAERDVDVAAKAWRDAFAT
jgi:hypothetical protein